MRRRRRRRSQTSDLINALLVLDLLAKALPYSIDEQLDDIKGIFLAGTPPAQAW